MPNRRADGRLRVDDGRYCVGAEESLLCQFIAPLIGVSGALSPIQLIPGAETLIIFQA